MSDTPQENPHPPTPQTDLLPPALPRGQKPHPHPMDGHLPPRRQTSFFPPCPHRQSLPPHEWLPTPREGGREEDTGGREAVRPGPCSCAVFKNWKQLLKFPFGDSGQSHFSF